MRQKFGLSTFTSANMLLSFLPSKLHSMPSTTFQDTHMCSHQQVHSHHLIDLLLTITCAHSISLAVISLNVFQLCQNLSSCIDLLPNAVSS